MVKCKEWTGGLSVVVYFCGIPPMMCAWQRHAGLGGGGGCIRVQKLKGCCMALDGGYVELGVCG